MEESKAKRARRRALRAAQVVTLGLAIAGCSASHQPEAPAPSDMVAEQMPMADGGSVASPSPDAEPEPSTDPGSPAAEDAAVVLADAGRDAAIEELDSGALADAGVSCLNEDGDWEATAQCCHEIGWDWDVPGCQAWGPYLPPGDELPESRSALGDVNGVFHA